VDLQDTKGMAMPYSVDMWTRVRLEHHLFLRCK